MEPFIKLWELSVQEGNVLLLSKNVWIEAIISNDVFSIGNCLEIRNYFTQALLTRLLLYKEDKLGKK